MVRVGLLVEQNWNAVPGGTARSANRLAKALAAYTSVEVVGVHGVHGAKPTLALPDGLETVQIPMPGRPLTESWSRFDRPSLDRWLEVDVVHAPAYVLPPTKAPRVATIHDLAFVRHPEWFTPNGVEYFTRFLRRVEQSDTVVIVPSQATADDCVARGIDESRIHTIGWGVDVAVATADQVADVTKRYGLPEDFVLFVGTLEPRKNVAALIDAMAHLPASSLVVVGPAGWGEIDLGGATVLGDVPDGDVEPLMAAAAVLVYPSHFEGFGLPVLEAMAQGTPVVTTQNTAPAELVEDAGIAVDTHSPIAIAEAVEGLLDSPSQRSELGERGRTRAATFRWDETARAHAAIYEDMS